MLDVDTPKGQEWLAQERRCAAIIEAALIPPRRYIGTPKPHGKGDCVIDGMLCEVTDHRGAEITAAVEIKARGCRLHTLRTAFNNEWLITERKIIEGAALAYQLRVPMWGYFYAVPDDVVLMVPLTDQNSALLRYRRQYSRTQATCNGGEADRWNAYIDMRRARELRPRTGTPRSPWLGVPDEQVVDPEWIASYEREEMRGQA